MEDVTLGFRGWGQWEIVVATLVLFCSTALWLVWSQSAGGRKGRRLPPGPRGWPIVGALPLMGQRPHLTFTEMSKTYGPVIYLKLFATPTLVVANAQMAKEVLQKNDQAFASRPEFLVPTNLFYNNLDIGFAPYGPYWRQARKIVNLQLLTPSRINHFMGVIKEEILNTVHNVLELPKAPGKQYADVHLSRLFIGATTNVITKMMWNKRHCNVEGDDRQSVDEFHELFGTAMVLLGMNNISDHLPAAIRPFAAKISGLQSQTSRIRNKLSVFCQNIIRERQEVLAKQGGDMAVKDDDDFLSILLKLKAEEGESAGLSNEAIQSILFDMVLGGTDTSTVSLDWIFSELMKHPHIMKKVEEELVTVVGKDRLVTEADIPNLKYLDAVVKEGLRLHPAGPLGVPHQSIVDCKVGGYDVPANCLVLVNIFAIHRDPSVWEKPDEFIPDRFLQSSLDYKGRNFEYIPFSSGRRMCPGMGLASTLLHFGLAQLVHTMSWSLPNGQRPEDVDFSPSTGLALSRAVPLLMNVKPKLAHHVIYPTK